MKALILLAACWLQIAFIQSNSSNNPVIKNPEDSIAVRITKINENMYMMDCVNGFGGGNVTASIGKEGVLIADDMYASMVPKLKDAIKTLSNEPIRIVLNSHFHGDHIQGNMMLKNSTVIIAHENVAKRLLKNNKESNPTTGMMPTVTFTDSININFNGEDIRIIHFPDCHTDGDAIIYFTKSKVLHMGDMFFFEMFPAVYTEGGGNIKKLVVALDKISTMFPPDTKVVPGHGNLATMKDLSDYISMLKETINIVESKIKAGITLDQMKQEKVLAKYDALGSGGAQTTDQYLSMLYKLLSPANK